MASKHVKKKRRPKSLRDEFKALSRKMDMIDGALAQRLAKLQSERLRDYATFSRACDRMASVIAELTDKCRILGDENRRYRARNIELGIAKLEVKN